MVCKSRVFILLVAVLVGFVSCKTLRKPVVSDSAERLLFNEYVSKNNANYNQLTVKRADLELKSPDLNASGKANIYIQHNKFIIVTVHSFLNIEVARAYISPDSIGILSRFERVYYRSDFSNSRLPFDKSGAFCFFEGLFSGNLCSNLFDNPSVFSFKEVQTGNTMYDTFESKFTYQSTSVPVVLEFVRTLNKLSRFTATYSTQNTVVSSNFSAFEVYNDIHFPTKIDYNLTRDSQVYQLKLSYPMVDIKTPIDISFSVPSGYKVETFSL